MRAKRYFKESYDKKDNIAAVVRGAYGAGGRVCAKRRGQGGAYQKRGKA
jgi:hypothetical protein